MKKYETYPVILAGGSGTRLWPLSKSEKPKQTLCFNGCETLIEQSVKRALFVSGRKPIIITNDTQAKCISEGLKWEADFLIEPEAKNTAPAIAFAVKEILNRDKDGIIAVLPSDHYLDEDGFKDVFEEAVSLAGEKNKIVLIGIEPTSPETGYGYIELGKQLDKNKTQYVVNSFKEKPNLEKAKEYLSTSKYLWNAGIFIAPVKILETELEKNLKAAKQYFEGLKVEDFYKNTVATSIDYAVIEKSDQVLVVRSNFKWNDLGTWKSIFDFVDKDDQENSFSGKTIGIGNKRTLVINESEKLISLVGLEDLVIVATKDEMLICHQDKAQEVKGLVEKIKKESL